jgi:hypothetical protein
MSFGSPKGSINIWRYIYRYTLDFSRRIFPKIQDYDWRIYNGAYNKIKWNLHKIYWSRGVLGLIRVISDQVDKHHH